jgi:hypothetical protein
LQRLKEIIGMNKLHRLLDAYLHNLVILL